MARTWIEINAAALIDNIHLLRQHAPKDGFVAVIKANAYGHGLLQIAEICLDNGVRHLAVHAVEAYEQLVNALEVKLHATGADVLIMGEPEPRDCDWRFAIAVVSSCEALKNLQAMAEIRGQTLRIDIKIDSGLSRLGTSNSELPTLLDALDQCPALQLRALMTHFANVEDVTDATFMDAQLVRFNDAVSDVNKRYQRKILSHAGSSAAGLLHPHAHCDMVRFGISLYGLWPSPLTRLSYHAKHHSELILKPVLSWRAQVIHIQTVAANRAIGYGCTYQTNHTTTIAVLPVGYYEGYARANNSHVLVEGKRAPILGRVCMNMMIIDVTHIANVTLGTTATLIGQDGSLHISADDLAAATATLNYEIVSRISPTLTRRIV